MTRRILTTLTLLALTVALSAGLLHAQGSTEAEPSPYRIDLYSGWNLISFPGDPVDGTLENVVGDAQVDLILGYQSDEWRAAVRKADGGWRTTNGFTTLSGGRGYWVHALADDTIEAALSPDAARPSPEGCGWHLAGVWDEEQRPPGTEVDADDYFYDTWWRVAYGFLTGENLWTKQLPNSDGTVETGAAYWVWISCPSPCPPVSRSNASAAYGFDTTTDQWDSPVHRGTTAGVGAGYRVQALSGAASLCP